MNPTRQAASHIAAPNRAAQRAGCWLFAFWCVTLSVLAGGCGRSGGESPAAGGGGEAGQAPGSAPGAPGKAGSSERDPGAVAQVGTQSISYRTFERYLNDNAGEDTQEGAEMDTIKSRLLDQLIEEHLLVWAAADLKIAVSDAEVQAYLKELGLTEGELDVNSPDGPAAFKERVKNSLIVQKVKEAAVLTKIQVRPGEVEDALRARPELTRASSLLVLRQILLEDRKTAEEVRSKLEADPSRFETLARERSAAPDKGQPRSYAEEDLPADLRDAVTPLQPGQVSPVLEHAQAFLIFQLVRRLEARTDLAEVRHQVESDLRRQKADQVMLRYLADLKEKTEIHVNRAILPFRYVGEFGD